MKAIVKVNSKKIEFNTWKDFENYLKDYSIFVPKRKYNIHLELYLAQATWSYDIRLDTTAMLEMIPVFKDIEKRVEAIWDQRLDSLPGDGSDW